MELYDVMKNIAGSNYEKLLLESIGNVKAILNGLTEERMCKVYSSYLLRELNNKHIPARIINTIDLGLEYEHEFVLVPTSSDNYFLADLTFSQFNTDVKDLNELLLNGYQLINQLTMNEYLNIVSNGNYINTDSVDNIFYLEPSVGGKNSKI